MREELESIVNARKNFVKDPILKAYFEGNKDLSIDIDELKDQIQELRKNVNEFRVAEDYHEIELQAGRIRRELQVYRNQELALVNRERDIQKSLETRPEIGLKELESLYSTVGVIFPETTRKTLTELIAFHETLASRRVERLKKDLAVTLKRTRECKERIDSLSVKLNDQLNYLGAHGALDEYKALVQRLASSEAHLSKLVDYKKLQLRYKTREQELTRDLSESTLAAQKYLQDNEDEIGSVRRTFRDIVKAIYPDKGAGLTIDVNEGDGNQVRYDIDAKIESDASDGINDARIFAFDFLVLSLKKNHNVEFCVHDSRLFSDMDPRQRANLFQLAFDRTTGSHLQYVATLNEDQLDAMKENFRDAAAYEKLEQSIVLRLSDSSDADKLLGTKIELDYQ